MKKFPIILISLVGVLFLSGQFLQRFRLQEKIAHQEGNPRNDNLSTRILKVSAPIIRDRDWDQEIVGEILASMELETGNSDELFDLLSEATYDDLERIVAALQDEAGARGILQNEVDDVIFQIKILKRQLDPGRAVKSGDLRSVFYWARRDPEAARSWLEEADLDEIERRVALHQINYGEWVTHPSSNLEYWKEESERDPSVPVSRSYGVPYFSGAALDELEALVNQPENAGSRDELIKALISSAALEGVDSMKSRAENLGLTASKILPALSPLEDFGSPQLLEWTAEMRDADPKTVYDVLHGMMATFTLRDMEGAAAWLEDFDGPQEVRDDLTLRYSIAHGRVDPEGSLQWVSQIQDDEKRERTSRDILYAWEYEDPQAFEEWKARQ